MMRATQRNQLHHRCIRFGRTVKSQVIAAAPPAWQAEGTAGPHAAPLAARVHANCKMLHLMQLRALVDACVRCGGLHEGRLRLISPLLNILKLDIQCVRTHWIRAFMPF